MTTAPTAEILELDQMAAYQDGSIVSRQITKAETGNVTLFAFDAGVGIGMLYAAAMRTIAVPAAAAVSL